MREAGPAPGRAADGQHEGGVVGEEVGGEADGAVGEGVALDLLLDGLARLREGVIEEGGGSRGEEEGGGWEKKEEFGCHIDLLYLTDDPRAEESIERQGTR